MTGVSKIPVEPQQPCPGMSNDAERRNELLGHGFARSGPHPRSSAATHDDRKNLHHRSNTSQMPRRKIDWFASRMFRIKPKSLRSCDGYARFRGPGMTRIVSRKARAGACAAAPSGSLANGRAPDYTRAAAKSRPPRGRRDWPQPAVSPAPARPSLTRPRPWPRFPSANARDSRKKSTLEESGFASPISG